MEELLIFLFETHLSETKTAANWFLIGSAVIISISHKLSSYWWIWCGFLVGHILWTFAGYHMDDPEIITLNRYFILLDLYAILIRVEPINRRIRIWLKKLWFSNSRQETKSSQK